ncbi:iron uptake system protein EfeO [Rhizobium halophytocola]|uniref:Iron uptake system EfeUOB component EfeO/EfeM n=1 Tax=Rhizobium halophytocola TaxID=735519 RepID=A0ABS4DU55_9HYPH|nr:iron uptake system protein EfeO [Rhizobium halophytocola]MBP1849239.1 iron uptake system EfeUOB component EfeO/EfeM [Rhizobium halophytocola]
MSVSDQNQPSRGLMVAGVAGAAVLALAAGAAFFFATVKNQAVTSGRKGLEVRVTANACDPADITVAAGTRTFDVFNASDRPVEWEILDGVMVVAERENIVPGIRQSVTATLAPGDYEITCGLISNAHGTLHVTPSKEYAKAASTLGLRDYLGPLSEYRVYLALQGKAAVDAAKALADAIHAGDLDKARTLYEPARVPFKHIEPVAFRMSDLENSIDATADYLEKREDDPEFSGFHRIEYGLYEQNSLDGLGAIADRLVADMTLLSARLKALKLDPAMLIALPGGMADHLLQGRIEKGEDHYARTDLADLEASLDGIDKVAGLLQAVSANVDPTLADEMTTAMTQARDMLASLKTGDHYPPYDTVDKAAREQLAKAVQTLAETYARLEGTIGVGA